MTAVISHPGANASYVTVVGAGLAGCEAAWQALRLGADVRLFDIKPIGLTPAHHMATFAELVCSNSLGALSMENAKGLLKQEMRELGSLIISAADANAVPAGGALAVDRELFSQEVTKRLTSNKSLRAECAEVNIIPSDRPCIIATGPLTAAGLSQDITKMLGRKNLSFFDAVAPIVSQQSIDTGKTFRASRYGKGGGDYINCPMTREQYYFFVHELTAAQKAELRDFDHISLFEGCMPVENMAERGADTLRFGPLKPKGLVDPATGREPYAVVQLRQDDAPGEMYNLVGFQTRLLFAEQRRVFRMIPGLERAEFLRYGVMHRNTYINSPGILDECYEVRSSPGLYFAGQITGVEGYVESASSGMVSGLNAALRLLGKGPLRFPPRTMTGALAGYVSAPRAGVFSPMNANFGLLPATSSSELQMIGSNELRDNGSYELQTKGSNELQATGSCELAAAVRRGGRRGRNARTSVFALESIKNMIDDKDALRLLL